jgi:hypothetical protein
VIALLEAMAERIPFPPPAGGTFVVERLASLLPHQAALVAHIAEALVKLWKGELSDIRTSAAAGFLRLYDGLSTELIRLSADRYADLVDSIETIR